MRRTEQVYRGLLYCTDTPFYTRRAVATAAVPAADPCDGMPRRRGSPSPASRNPPTFGPRAVGWSIFVGYAALNVIRKAWPSAIAQSSFTEELGLTPADIGAVTSFHGAAYGLSKFFSAGACKDVSTLGEKTKDECNDAAKKSAEKTLGRKIRPVEFTRMREDSAVAVAASLREDCPPDQDGCDEAAIEKLKSITGDAQITRTKVEKYIRSGTQRSAATDMESCLAKQKTVTECRAELSTSVARSLGKSKSVPVEEVQEIVRSGARSSAYQKLVACREAAGDDAEKKKACSSREVRSEKKNLKQIP